MTDSTKEIIQTTFKMTHGKIVVDRISKDRNSRYFKGILSGEVVDQEGDLIPINEFVKFFPTLMKRKTPLLLNHTI